MDSLTGERSQTQYVALLRGINVGGRSVLKMADLKAAFEFLGFTNVKTVLASGNVLFEAPEQNPGALSDLIMQKLRDTFGREIYVIVRTVDYLRKLEAQRPFEGIAVQPRTRLIVTFLADNVVQPNIADLPSRESFKIKGIFNGAICSVIDEEDGTATVELMSVLEKEFGKQVTTRTWNTVIRILKK